MSPLSDKQLSDYCSYSCGCCASSCTVCRYKEEAQENKREGKYCQPPAIRRIDLNNLGDYSQDTAFQAIKALISDINLSCEDRKTLITYCENKKDDFDFIAALKKYDSHGWLGMILEFYFPLLLCSSERALVHQMDKLMSRRREYEQWRKYSWRPDM